MAKKPTIKSLMDDMHVNHYRLPDHMRWDGAYCIVGQSYVAVWPYRLHGNAKLWNHVLYVKHKRSDTRQHIPVKYIDRWTVDTINAYDRATGATKVAAGPVGMRRALARWIKDNG